MAGCASTPKLTNSDKAQLLERAEARWHALMVRDWESAYAFMSPAYRDVFSYPMFRQRFSYSVKWELTSVELVNYDAPAAVASVAIGVMSRPVKPTSAASKALGATPARIVEQWVNKDGSWWYGGRL
ncbi:conserved hypothetical protein [gamma proteobacterium NOR5-3]|nr:conserved hypothetical protein [gamma proteobacterium NOR5-3]